MKAAGRLTEGDGSRRECTGCGARLTTGDHRIEVHTETAKQTFCAPVCWDLYQDEAELVAYLGELLPYWRTPIHADLQDLLGQSRR